MILNILEHDLNSYKNNPYYSHEDSSLLLPWYINKSLNNDEIKLVESHLKVCIICKRELAILQKVASAIKTDKTDYPNKSSTENFTKLINRIHNTTYSAANDSLNSPIKENHHQVLPTANQVDSRVRTKLYRLPKTALGMAAALMLSLIIPRFFVNDNSLINDYHTLSSAEIPVINQNTVRVIFLNDTDKLEINKLLATVNGQITSGPSGQGEYSVAIKNKLTPENAQGILAELKKNTNVLFAEPAYALASSEKTIGN